MICSQDMADYWTNHFSLGGTYISFVITKTASEPFSAQGDLDQDGVTNGEEYQNNEAAGGDIDSFMAAANNPNSNGKTLPAMGMWGALLCVALLLAFGRRRILAGGEG